MRGDAPIWKSSNSILIAHVYFIVVATLVTPVSAIAAPIIVLYIFHNVRRISALRGSTV